VFVTYDLYLFERFTSEIFNAWNTTYYLRENLECGMNLHTCLSTKTLITNTISKRFLSAELSKYAMKLENGPFEMELNKVIWPIYPCQHENERCIVYLQIGIEH
jgi:hypothetical protein